MKNIQEIKPNEYPDKSGANRQKNGTFGVGNTANPNGRPKGSGISITTAIKRELEKVPEGHKTTYLDLLVKKILKKGIIDGDNQTQKNIWNYVDGMPEQKTDFTTKGEKIMYMPSEIMSKNEIPSNSEPGSEEQKEV